MYLVSTQRISLCKNIVKNTTEQLGKNSSDKIQLTSRVQYACFVVMVQLLECRMNHRTNQIDTSSKKQQRGLVFDSNASIVENQSKGKCKRMNKSARARETRRLEFQQWEEEERAESYVSKINSISRIVLMLLIIGKQYQLKRKKSELIVWMIRKVAMIVVGK